MKCMTTAYLICGCHSLRHRVLPLIKPMNTKICKIKEYRETYLSIVFSWSSLFFRSDACYLQKARLMYSLDPMPFKIDRPSDHGTIQIDWPPLKRYANVHAYNVLLHACEDGCCEGNACRDFTNCIRTCFPKQLIQISSTTTFHVRLKVTLLIDRSRRYPEHQLQEMQ